MLPKIHPLEDTFISVWHRYAFSKRAEKSVKIVSIIAKNFVK
jgi:hypothetical protein